MNEKRLSGPRQSTKLALFALSGNECAFPGCDAPMYEENTILGEFAHIHAQNPGGPRYKAGLVDEELHGFGNLLLMCQKHHKIVDDHPEQYNADRLRRIKAGHENRDVVTSNQQLRRLIEALAPTVPDDWWERPSAPRFTLHLGSSRPPTGSWRYNITVEQVDGGDISILRYRYRLGEREYELEEASFRERRKWRLDDLNIQPRGVPFVLELRFWWSGAERTVFYRWETESKFQNVRHKALYELPLDS